MLDSIIRNPGVWPLALCSTITDPMGRDKWPGTCLYICGFSWKEKRYWHLNRILNWFQSLDFWIIQISHNYFSESNTSCPWDFIFLFLEDTIHDLRSADTCSMLFSPKLKKQIVKGWKPFTRWQSILCNVQ